MCAVDEDERIVGARVELDAVDAARAGVRVRDALCALLPEKPKFKALAVDLAKLACGETSLDALLAYELPAAAQ